MINQRQDDFQQRVVAAMYPHDPTLERVAQLFPNDEEASVDSDGIFYPKTPEEFEQMMELWDQEVSSS